MTGNDSNLTKLVSVYLYVIYNLLHTWTQLLSFSLSRETLPPTHTNSLQNDMRDYSILGASFSSNQYYS